MPESCVYAPYQHFVLLPSRSTWPTTDLRILCSTCIVLRGPAMICSLGYNPLPTSSSLLSLSLSLHFPLCCLQGRRRRPKLLTTTLIQNGMRWGLAASCCCSPKFAALICFPFHLLYFHKTLLYFIPSHSVSHTCTNAEFDVELTGSPQWLRGAQGGGL